ncbi:Protein kinase, ATP binding site domain-containing protein [Rozella allomycis CSF55]|uniref:non-specific serine/threonine protein kinase n=1 Tax=Rozella allomycis (strain CSF55) TaxID=988480 RepID=A0A075AW39_ROZAC|nr:Protein kinase, ATP binding site domain-containing protein [Rozella allomycis CSF55]|eukprot:EPZ34372.1 Protein kinase, ATP binding site domain-containing protein [Rozella allomycis CSF55]
MSRRRNDDSDQRTVTPSVVGVHYRVGRKIGEGSFGIIYEGLNLLNNQAVAIKFEPRKSDAPQLRDEYRTYKILAGCVGIPSVSYFGQEGFHNVLVLDLLGPSLEDLFEMCNRKFSLPTIAKLAVQMIAKAKEDIKPDNFLIGRGSQSDLVYLVDFGMAKYYRDPKTKQHIPYRERKSLSGTARYMSINTHLGREQSRRDDLEALGHVFVYFLRQQLPWQGLKAATNKQKYEKIGEKKQQVSIKDLCEGFPDEVAAYMTYTRNLGFEETPNYDYLISLFKIILEKCNVKENDVKYDWINLKELNNSNNDYKKNEYKSGMYNTNDVSQNQRNKNTTQGTNNLHETKPRKGIFGKLFRCCSKQSS